MVWLSSKLNGTPRWSRKLTKAKKPALTLSALLVLCLPTAACFEATRSTVTAGQSPSASKARCAGWRSIQYDYLNDTMGTIQQVRQHNQTGVNKKCWKERP